MTGVTCNYLITGVRMLSLCRIEGVSNCEDVLTALPTLAGGTIAKIAAALGRRVIIYDSLIIFSIKNQNNNPNTNDSESGTVVFIFDKKKKRKMKLTKRA